MGGALGSVLGLPSASDLTAPLHKFDPRRRACGGREGGGGQESGGGRGGGGGRQGVPYALLGAALDALESTRSRLSKEVILTNTFRAMIACGAPPGEIEAGCYLLSPAKDPQQGGHRLRPDWAAGERAAGC